ncbi:ribosome biogenesis protein Rei1 [Schizosaccharomyces pombe]|uniref:Cytoplasmic 60S subunit biogenesis factor SPCC550.15c n=1 Tax=Schizosaccharomyces pombe (strain 972 / ATCC 24843) TaxID=284812 RepID=REI1_SCHPO|nr:putative ribosome biogenesis protein [Schizosaccharomyces pombe]O59811.1 RecName: Full=Cytoplasmic 60S subunit biogenesis factor SPCC550.15c; AltName: Full=pre-60S factor REI1 homolog [Schizosaccharomyces pombe 972h-]CAA19119.1 ribosome biogenesis protein (predicted) [Schizosaccharomyces pombe]|eukprot:NP_588107.1 putative ribosome biogenesis protein [Schizosaccharomyces pombe]
MSTSFACTTCTVAFNNAESQKIHWKSDWHHYNLKRKVASLPPLSAEVFAGKILSIQKQNEEVQKKAEFYQNCEVCNKKFYSEGAYSSHMASKKHRDNLSKFQRNSRIKKLQSEDASSIASSTLSMGEPVVDSEIEEEEDLASQLTSRAISLSNLSLHGRESEPSKTELATSIPQSNEASKSHLFTQEPTPEEIEAELARRSSQRLSPRDCLFCAASFSSFDTCKKHMKASHSLYIPEREYLVDEPSLFDYLAEKISIGFTCLTCNREFKSLEAVRAHMQQKGHTSIAYDTEDEQLELSDFYDFTTSYPDYAVKQDETVVEEDGSSGEGDWEDVSDDSDNSSLDSLEMGRVPIADEYELHLPSGNRVGHRSLSRYFRQNLHSSSTAVGDGASIHQNVARRAMSGNARAYRQAVETSIAGVRDGRKNYSASHIKSFQDQRRREEFANKMGIKNNTKKHFRDALLQ